VAPFFIFINPLLSKGFDQKMLRHHTRCSFISRRHFISLRGSLLTRLRCSATLRAALLRIVKLQVPKLCSGVLCALTFSAQAAPDDKRFGTSLANSAQSQYAVQTSLWTAHFNNKPYHNNQQRLIGVERIGANIATNAIQNRIGLFDSASPLAGATFFKNSFHQSTGYAYIGFRQPLVGDHHNNMYIKLTSGVMHGYRGEYRDKIPFNRFGTSVVAIPSAGVQIRRFTAETVLFGAAGVMLNVGYQF
jgi:hypothetical protein